MLKSKKITSFIILITLVFSILFSNVYVSNAETITIGNWDTDARSLTDTILGEVPGGNYVSFFMNILWPQQGPDIYEELKEKIQNQIDNSLVSFRDQFLKANIDNIESNLRSYQLSDNEKGYYLRSAEQWALDLKSKSIELTDDQRKYILPVMAAGSTLYMQVLSEQINTLNLNDQDKSQKKKLMLEGFNQYNSIIYPAYEKWKVWRKNYITLNTQHWPSVAHRGNVIYRMVVTDNFTGKVVYDATEEINGNKTGAEQYRVFSAKAQAAYSQAVSSAYLEMDATMNLVKSLSNILKTTGVGRWEQVPGSLSQISVASSDKIWGVNSANLIYSYIGNNNWQGINTDYARKKCISIAKDGTVWGVNSADQIWKLENGTWSLVSGSLKQISVGSKDHIWGVSSDNKIWKYENGNWKQINGSLKSVSVGCDGEVWGVNASDEIFRYSGTDWIKIPGGLKQISVGATGCVWGVNSSNEVYRYNRNDWEKVVGNMNYVSVGSDGTAWGLDTNNNIFRFTH